LGCERQEARKGTKNYKKKSSQKGTRKDKGYKDDKIIKKEILTTKGTKNTKVDFGCEGWN